MFTFSCYAVNVDVYSKTFFAQQFQQKKSHTYEKGGGNLRISFWHLLMNLKNKYVLKKLLKWANKKQNNFNIYNVAFLKKNKEKNPELSLSKSRYDLQFLRYRAKLTEICNFRSFFALLPPSPKTEKSKF